MSERNLETFVLVLKTLGAVVEFLSDIASMASKKELSAPERGIARAFLRPLRFCVDWIEAGLDGKPRPPLPPGITEPAPGVLVVSAGKVDTSELDPKKPDACCPTHGASAPSSQQGPGEPSAAARKLEAAMCGHGFPPEFCGQGCQR